MTAPTEGRVAPVEVTAVWVAPSGHMTVDDLVDFLDVVREAGVPGSAVVRFGRRRARRVAASGQWSGRLA